MANFMFDSDQTSFKLSVNGVILGVILIVCLGFLTLILSILADTIYVAYFYFGLLVVLSIHIFIFAQVLKYGEGEENLTVFVIYLIVSAILTLSQVSFSLFLIITASVEPVNILRWVLKLEDNYDRYTLDDFENLEEINVLAIRQICFYVSAVIMIIQILSFYYWIIVLRVYQDVKHLIDYRLQEQRRTSHSAARYCELKQIHMEQHRKSKGFFGGGGHHYESEDV